MSGRGGRGGGRGIIDSSSGRGGRRKFNSSSNQTKRQEMKIYPHGTGPDQQTAAFTKVN